MPPRHRKSELHEHVVAVMGETGADDPFEAVRIKARKVVASFHHTLGAEPPFCMETMTSFRGLHLPDDEPRFSSDSEIAPEADGRVVLRVNKEMPLCSQRFSICQTHGQESMLPSRAAETRTPTSKD